MIFNVISRETHIPGKGSDIAYLKIDRWNDFSFTTMFYLCVFDVNGVRHDIGNIKIGFKGQDTSQSTHVKLKNTFSTLTSEFFSIGENLEFYKKMSKLDKHLRENLLRSLNDIAFMPDIINEVQDEEVFRVSLLRDLSLTSIKGQFSRVLNGKPALTDFKFAFERENSDELCSIKLNFNVKESSTPSTNIHALIGRNGSGKTTILNGMIEAITAPTSTAGRFIDTDYGLDMPIDSNYFSSLISVSFSAFDPFEPPREQPNPSKGTCYFYIGLKDPNNIGANRTLFELRSDFVKSLIDCFRITERRELWNETINKLCTDENFSLINLAELIDIYIQLRHETKGDEQVDSKEFQKLYLTKIQTHLSNLSSGHAIVLFTITKLISTIEEKTLVLLDEPEGHLHPPLLSAFIRTLSELLFDKNGVAIIATHSPVVLQEIPKSCVWKINRIHETICPHRPNIETFGENVGILTREVFGLEVVTSGYHSLLSKSVKSGKTYDDILSDYKNQLGLEARSVLKSLVVSRDNGKDI